MNLLPKISSDVIEIEATAGQPVTIEHGFGRQITGWLVIWSNAAVTFHVEDAAADTSQTLVLIPNANASVRLVLL